MNRSSYIVASVSQKIRYRFCTSPSWGFSSHNITSSWWQGTLDSYTIHAIWPSFHSGVHPGVIILPNVADGLLEIENTLDEITLCMDPCTMPERDLFPKISVCFSCNLIPNFGLCHFCLFCYTVGFVNKQCHNVYYTSLDLYQFASGIWWLSNDLGSQGMCRIWSSFDCRVNYAMPNSPIGCVGFSETVWVSKINGYKLRTLPLWVPCQRVFKPGPFPSAHRKLLVILLLWFYILTILPGQCIHI